MTERIQKIEHNSRRMKYYLYFIASLTTLLFIIAYSLLSLDYSYSQNELYGEKVVEICFIMNLVNFLNCMIIFIKSRKQGALLLFFNLLILMSLISYSYTEIN